MVKWKIYVWLKEDTTQIEYTTQSFSLTQTRTGIMIRFALDLE